MNLYLVAATLAQMPQDAVVLKQFADEVSQKDFRWWFAIVFGILITGVTFIVKWLIATLNKQRDSNTEIQKEFINYMREDRLKAAVLLERVTMVLEKIEEEKRFEILGGHRERPSHTVMGNLPKSSPSDQHQTNQ